MTEQPAATNTKPQTHYASRLRSVDYLQLISNSLPDANTLLARLGWDSSQLRRFITADPQVRTVWDNTRITMLTQHPWRIVAADDSQAAQQAADSYRTTVLQWNNYSLMRELIHAVALGYSVAEILWQPQQSQWQISDVVPKPAHWFAFDAHGQLLFRRSYQNLEPVPDNRFLVVQHNASYANPYGEQPLFHVLYWLILFKRHSLEWWLRFVERFGGAALFGKYNTTANDDEKKQLMQALTDLLSSSAAIGPEDSSIEVIGDTAGSQHSAAHKDFIDHLDKAIAKATLGQHLSSDAGDKGARSLGEVQFKVLEAIAHSDRQLIATAYNHLAQLYTRYNFGEQIQPPRLQFETAEDLKLERAERDQKLYNLGWRPTPNYLMQHYGMSEDDFTLAAAETPAFQQFSHQTEQESFADKEPSDSDKEESEEEKTYLAQTQEELDKLQETYFNHIEQATDYQQALQKTEESYASQKKHRSRLAKLFNNLRHIVRNIAASKVK